MHQHWIIWAYRRKDDAGNYEDNTILDIVATDWSEALARAEAIVPLMHKGGSGMGAGYRVAQVVEHFDGACGRS